MPIIWPPFVRNKALLFFRAKWFLIGMLVTIFFCIPGVQNAWRWNSRAILLLKEEPIAVTASGCNHIWLAAAEAGRRGDLTEQRQFWEQALSCSPGNVSLLQKVLPLDVDMARLATQAYPDNPSAWFWFGEAIAPTDHLSARQAYLRTVALNPGDGLAWCRLGSNYESSGQIELAWNAFVNCCYHGDPGMNGCYGAGRMMEKFGNIQQAIRYYRLSRWQGALDRADKLEAQLNAP